MADQDSGFEHGPGWQHVDDVFEAMDSAAPGDGMREERPAFQEQVSGEEAHAGEPPQLDQRVSMSANSGTELPDAFLHQCQSLWRQAMNIAGEAYQRMKSELTHRIEELTAERDALLAERDELRDEFQEFRQSTSSQVEHLGQYESQLSEVKAALELERDLQKRQSRELAERDRQLEEALQVVGVNESRVQQVESALQKEVDGRREVEAQLERASEEISSNSDAASLQAELNRVSSKLEVTAQERDRLTKDLNEAFETINFSMDRSRQLEQELTEARAAVAKQEARVDEVKTQVSSMDGELAMLRKKNEMVNREAQAFAEKNAELLRRFHEAQIPAPQAD